MRWTYFPPAAYLAFALYVWVDFTHTSQDGLANLGLLLATYPVAALGRAHLGSGSDRLCPHSKRNGLLHGTRHLLLARSSRHSLRIISGLLCACVALASGVTFPPVMTSL